MPSCAGKNCVAESARHLTHHVCVAAQNHHKNSNRHGQQAIGPFTLRASGTDGEVFIRSITGWLERGLPRLLSLFDQADQPYAFLHPTSCRPFSVASFCSYFKKHIYRVSKCDISPGKLRYMSVISS